MEQNVDLFGCVIDENQSLRERYGENPFTILDTKTASWQNRKRQWSNLGIKSEVGRNAKAYNTKEWVDKVRSQGNMKGNVLPSNTSIFDPTLCEVLYRWFCPTGGQF